MALAAVLEADLRAVSAEARRKFPAVKEAAEHAIFKLRTNSDPSQITKNDDVLKLYFLACESRNVKLIVLGLSCLQKLLAHDAVPRAALFQILVTLQEHSEISDENLQLKTLQTILTILQSQLHPEDEKSVAILLGLCLRFLGNNRNADSVHSTAAATLRQAVALIFERVTSAEALPQQKFRTSRSRSNSVSSDVSRSMMAAKSEENLMLSGVESRETISQMGRLGIRLVEDLASLASGAQASWLSVHSLQRTFALDMLDYVLSNHVSLFKNIKLYQEALRHRICSLLITSLRTTAGADGEPAFRRAVFRAVANVIRLYSSVIMTECEVFINTLVKNTDASLPFWHRIMVLETLRGFCIEARISRFLYETFDMHPENTDVVGVMVKSLSRIVTSIQMNDAGDEILGVVSGMFNSKAKGIEWSMESDGTTAMSIASEAHALTLAIEGLLGVVFTVATLTDEAAESGEVESPRCEVLPSVDKGGQHAVLCVSMVNGLWQTLLEALSLILVRCHGEALVLEILKGYQAFTQACGVLRLVQPRDAFLASLCKFTFACAAEPERTSGGPMNMISLIPLTPSAMKRDADLRDSVVLSPKNVQALRTLFNIAHRLDNVLGSSWILVLETLAILDRFIHSPNATTQEVSTVVPRLARDQGGQSSDFNILSTLDTQLFESSGMMSTAAVCSLLAGLREVSNFAVLGMVTSIGQPSGNVGSASAAQGQQTGPKMFAVERMITVLLSNLHRPQAFWNGLTDHFLELAEHDNSYVRSVALDALDRAILAVLGCEEVRKEVNIDDKQSSFECAIIRPIKTLYNRCRNVEVKLGSLRILLHLLGRHIDKLHHCWLTVFELLRSVSDSSEKELVPLGFQCLRVLMDDGLISMPASALDICAEVAGAYGSQTTDLNVSLTALGLLWAASDFFARGVSHEFQEAEVVARKCEASNHEVSTAAVSEKDFDSDKRLMAVFGVIQSLSTDERPEVRNSAIRTLFQAVCAHGHKLSALMWKQCLWELIFPLVHSVRHMAASSSNVESLGKELGMQDGKPVHMLVHHSRNTAQKQWDESLVLVLNGVSRILKPFLHLFQKLENFKEAWLTILQFAQESITSGSKEVALAAISALQIVIVAQASKGTLAGDYFESALVTYEKAVYGVCCSTSKVLAKTKQELLQSLGEVYVHGHSMFKDTLYLQLLALVDLLLKHPLNASDKPAAVRVGIPQVHRTALDVLPWLKPLDTRLVPMWPIFFQQLLSYLPGGGFIVCEHCKAVEEKLQTGHSPKSELQPNFDVAFSERVVDILVDLYKSLPYHSKESILPDILAAIGRCMALRREFPEGTIWRTAVKAYNQLLQEEFPSSPSEHATKACKAHVCKEVADVYESFLVGTCGRAIAFSGEQTSAVLKADEDLEASLLDVLAEYVLPSCEDAMDDVISRLIDLIDRCAARTSALSLDSAALLPSHCGRFSLLCLRKLFYICCRGSPTKPANAIVNRMALPVLVRRCEIIIRQFCSDERTSTSQPLPNVRMDEIYCVLEELSKLQLNVSASENCAKKASERSHLLSLYDPLCELVITRDQKVRDFVSLLLRLVGFELGLVQTGARDH